MMPLPSASERMAWVRAAFRPEDGHEPFPPSCPDGGSAVQAERHVASDLRRCRDVGVLRPAQYRCSVARACLLSITSAASPA